MSTVKQSNPSEPGAVRNRIPPELFVVDCDGHILETEEAFEKHIDPQFKAQCPRVVKPFGDSDSFFLIDLVLYPPFWPFNGRYPVGYGTLGFRHAGRGAAAPHQPMRADVGDLSTHARLRDMDIEGRDIDVIFPSIMLNASSNQHQNLPAIAAICRAYNDWLADYCRADPDRLKGVAVTCLHDIDTATREVNRCVTQLGFVAALIAPANPGDKTLDDPYFYPFFGECQRLGIPIGIHIALQRNPDHLQRTIHRDFNLTFSLVTIPNLIGLGQLIFGGVLDRFPTLRWIILESGVGWVPHFIERFDDKYKTMVEIFGKEAQTLEKLPSEYARSEQLFFSCDPDEAGLPFAVEFLGEDRITYASDYPHHDAKFPDSVRMIWEHPKLSESAKRKILGANAARLYGLTSHERRRKATA